MKNIKCSNCSNEISQKAPTCPQCGHPNKKANYLSGGETFLYLALVAGAIWWLASGDSSSNTPKAPPKPKYDAFQAQADCENFVEKSLKAPSTAEFAPHRELTISGNDKGPWTVIGYVDAQNSFGAQIRSKYRCTVHYEGKNVYLDNIQIN